MTSHLWQRTDLPSLLAAELQQPGERHWGRAFAPQLTYGRHGGLPRVDAPAAAVAVVLSWDGTQWSLPLTVRPTHLRRHGGQVSFPGGLLDPGESPRDAAQRELDEELGVRPALVWLGELSTQFVYASNATLKPCIAAIDHAPRWKPQPAEVDRVLRLDLERLCDDATDPPLIVQRGPFRFSAPRFIVEDQSAWGATAVVLGELRGRLRRIARHLASSPS